MSCNSRKHGRRFPAAGWIRLASITILMAAGHTASADTYVQQIVRTEPYKMMLSEKPAEIDTVHVWLGKDRASLKSQGTNAILRKDQSRLYILNPAARTFTAAPYPCDLLGLYPAGSSGQIAMRQLLNTLAPKVEVTPTSETKVIKGYPCKLYRVDMKVAKASIISETWMTTRAPADIGLFRDLMKAVLSVLPSTASLSKSLDSMEGLTVLDEQRVMSPSREMLSIRELNLIRESAPPAGVYEVPAGFKETPFDPASLRQ